MANGNTGIGQASHEYFNLPAVDIRITAEWCYFDIELAGVTVKAGINIHWVSSQSFIVEGEISRPRIFVQDKSDDDPTIKGWTNCAGKPIDPPTRLISLSGHPTRKQTENPINESVALNGETKPKPRDDYPGFSHLLRCPGSGIHCDDEASPAHLTSTDPQEPENGQGVPEPSTRHSPPMDEIALMHSRSTSSNIFSHRHKPHNDHDIQPDTRKFRFPSNHNEHHSSVHNPAAFTPVARAPIPGNKVRSSSTASNDVLRPIITDRNEPQLVLTERLIGTYKRLCTIPGDGAVKVHVEGTETKLEAGVLTVRVPRRSEKESREENSDFSSG